MQHLEFVGLCCQCIKLGCWWTWTKILLKNHNSPNSTLACEGCIWPPPLHTRTTYYIKLQYHGQCKKRKAVVFQQWILTCLYIKSCTVSYHHRMESSVLICTSPSLGSTKYRFGKEKNPLMQKMATSRFECKSCFFRPTFTFHNTDTILTTYIIYILCMTWFYWPNCT